MKVLIDANIILDVLQKREPHLRASAIVWKLCETKKITVRAEFIITRNVKDFLKSSIPAYTPLEFLERIDI